MDRAFEGKKPQAVVKALAAAPCECEHCERVRGVVARRATAATAAAAEATGALCATQETPRWSASNYKARDLKFSLVFESES